MYFQAFVASGINLQLQFTPNSWSERAEDRVPTRDYVDFEREQGKVSTLFRAYRRYGHAQFTLSGRQLCYNVVHINGYKFGKFTRYDSRVYWALIMRTPKGDRAGREKIDLHTHTHKQVQPLMPYSFIPAPKILSSFGTEYFCVDPYYLLLF